MATRIPVSWLIVLVLVAVFAFFAYHIVQTVSSKEAVQASVPPQFQAQQQQPQPSYMAQPSEQNDIEEEEYAEHAQRAQPAPKPMPRVVGQTEDDLRAPEQLQASPPTTQYYPPESTDPMNKHVHMGAEFGSNLRHPEQMIERRPPANAEYIVPSGLGSEQTSDGGNREVNFTPDMAQNGGEFMKGISAFDLSESGTAYSML